MKVSSDILFFYYKNRNKLNLIIVERKIITIQYKGQEYQLFLAFLHFRHECRKVLGKVRTRLFLDLRDQSQTQKTFCFPSVLQIGLSKWNGSK